MLEGSHKGTSTAAWAALPACGAAPPAAGPYPPRSGVMTMKVRDGMTRLVLTIGPAHTLREAARLMSGRRVGAAVVVDSEHSGVGILTERDIVRCWSGAPATTREERTTAPA